MSRTAAVQGPEDLLEHVDHPPAQQYIRLLARCAAGEQKVGVLDNAVYAEAVSDWEAAAICEGDYEVEEMAEIREVLCRSSPLIVRHGSRKGQATYRFHSDLIGADYDDNAIEGSQPEPQTGNLFGGG